MIRNFRPFRHSTEFSFLDCIFETPKKNDFRGPIAQSVRAADS